VTHRQSSIETMASVVQLLTRAPRTAQELCHLTDTSRNAVDRYIHALRDEGLIVRAPEHDVPSGAAKQNAWRWVS
jgi:DNA-binding IclR family transcriptional regulator